MIFGSDAKHLTRSVLLEEIGLPGMVHAIAAFSIGIIVLFLVWTVLARVEEVALAPGELVPTASIQRLQHPEGGVVSFIGVQEGELVSKGQVLVSLDTLSARTEYAQAQISRQNLAAEKTRLLALLGRTDPEATREGGGAVNDQRQIIKQARADRKLKRALFEARFHQRRADLEGLGTRRRFLLQRLEIVRQELSDTEELLGRGLSTQSQVLALRKQLSDLEGELESLPSRETHLEQEIAEMRTEMRRMENETSQQALIRLAKVDEELAQNEEIMRRSGARLRDSEIRAPLAGVVNHLRVRTVGAVIGRGEVIAEIVPQEPHLLAEVHISPRDVGHVHEGLPVTLRLTSYDYSRFGGISGKLVSVSAGPFLEPNGSPYHKGIVALDADHLGRFPVIAGMTLQADIKTGSKSIFEYLLKPIYASAGQAMRER